MFEGAAVMGFLVTAVLVNALGAALVKRQINRIGPAPLHSLAAVVGYFLRLGSDPLALSGAAMIFVSPVITTIPLSRVDVSVVYPLMVGLNAAILFLFAILFLDERLTWRKTTVIVLLVTSFYLLSE